MDNSILIANRGEIAVRIIRAAAELNIPTLAVYSEDDAESLHVRMADDAVALKGRGARAYLDQRQILAAAKARGCWAVHPGYGFLAENAEFARSCENAGICFIGPTAESLALFGNKAAARRAARECEIPLMEATEGPTTLEAAQRFFSSPGAGDAVMIKALAGGGGRGMRA